MTLGSGLAVCGIWAAVAVCAYLIGAPAMLVALFATIVTIVIAAGSL